MRSICALLALLPLIACDLLKLDKFENVISDYNGTYTRELAVRVFTEEAERIGIPVQSHIDACFDALERIDGWFVVLIKVIHATKDLYETKERWAKHNETTFHVNTTDGMLALAYEADPESYRSLFKYIETTKNALKDVNQEAISFGEVVLQTMLDLYFGFIRGHRDDRAKDYSWIMPLYKNLSDQAKNDIEMKFCYITEARIVHDNEETREIITFIR